MASKRLAVLAALFCLWMPLASSGQTVAPAGRTVSVTGLGTASGSVTGVIIKAIVRGPVDAAGLEEALRKAGIQQFVDDRSAFSFIPSVVGVNGRLPAVTHEDIDAATRAVKAYVNAHRGASVLLIRFYGLAKDCTALAPQARDAAMTDAQMRAQAVAGSMGVRLGSSISVAEHGACGTGGRLGGSRSIDAQTLEMTIKVEENVTYAVGS
jgi:uncharacterized protein YggE